MVKDNTCKNLAKKYFDILENQNDKKSYNNSFVRIISFECYSPQNTKKKPNKTIFTLKNDDLFDFS
jgi:hypothetical protein